MDPALVTSLGCSIGHFQSFYNTKHEYPFHDYDLDLSGDVESLFITRLETVPGAWVYVIELTSEGREKFSNFENTARENDALFIFVNGALTLQMNPPELDQVREPTGWQFCSRLFDSREEVLAYLENGSV